MGVPWYDSAIEASEALIPERNLEDIANRFVQNRPTLCYWCSISKLTSLCNSRTDALRDESALHEMERIATELTHCRGDGCAAKQHVRGGLYIYKKATLINA